MAPQARAQKTQKPQKQNSFLVEQYLAAYNTACLFGWSYVFGRLLNHQIDPPKKFIDDLINHIQVWLDSATTSDLQLFLQEQIRRASTAEADIGKVVAVVQTIAILEVVHVLFGFVRSSLATTMMQVASRLWSVWVVLGLFPQVSTSPIYATMILAWSIAEMVRFSNYLAVQFKCQVSLLEYARYSLFYVLYPLGAGSEAYLMYLAAPYAGQKFGTMAQYGMLAMFISWFPGLFTMMSHMHKQRVKYMRRSQKNE